MSFRSNRTAWALLALILLVVGWTALAIGVAAPVASAQEPTATPVSAPTVAPTSAPSAGETTTPSADTPPVPNCSLTDCTQPGPAITQNLTGDPTAGAQVFSDNCVKCHGDQGKQGVDNPGSTDGTVPNLNPIDSAFTTSDPKAFAAQIDAFIEHGSTPDGPSPKNVMDSWGDSGKLTPQQIADVIAYIMSLNK